MCTVTGQAPAGGCDVTVSQGLCMQACHNAIHPAAGRHGPQVLACLPGSGCTAPYAAAVPYISAWQWTSSHYGSNLSDILSCKTLGQPNISASTFVT